MWQMILISVCLCLMALVVYVLARTLESDIAGYACVFIASLGIIFAFGGLFTFFNDVGLFDMLFDF